MRVIHETPHPSEFSVFNSYINNEYNPPPIGTVAATSTRDMLHLPSNIPVNAITRYFFSNSNLDFLQHYIVNVINRQGHNIVRQSDQQLSIIMATTYNAEMHTVKHLSPREAASHLNTIVVNQVIPSIRRNIFAKKRRAHDKFRPSSIPKPIISNVDRSHHMPHETQRIRFG